MDGGGGSSTERPDIQGFQVSEFGFYTFPTFYCISLAIIPQFHNLGVSGRREVATRTTWYVLAER